MINNIIYNVFATESKNEFSAAWFNHCSSICQHKNGVLLTWYAGSGECKDDQSVYLMFQDDKTVSDPVRIGDKTGNPVLWADGKSAILLWSRFDDAGYVLKSPVERWKLCSIWIQRVEFDKGIRFLDKPKKIVDVGQHLLGRCTPIKTSTGSILLPLYNEVFRCGVIYQIDDMKASLLGTIGKDMIQPTIWEINRIIYSLSRNFSNRRELYAKSSHSDDFGATWSKPRRTIIDNNNSSLHTVQWCGETYVLWNDTQSLVRRNLTLGRLSVENMGIVNEAVPNIDRIWYMADYGSYPSMCIDKYNRLHMTYTNKAKRINHHVWNRKFFTNREYVGRRNPPKH